MKNLIFNTACSLIILLSYSGTAQPLSFNGPILCDSVSSDPDGDGWGWENNRSCRVSSLAQCEDRGTWPWGWNAVTRESCRLDSNPYAGECVDSPPLNDGWGWNGAQSCRLEVTGTGSCEDHGSYPWGWNAVTRESCRLDEDANQELLMAIEDQSSIWKSFALESYTYRHNAFPSGSDPGCPVAGIPAPVLVNVENGSVVSVRAGTVDVPIERYQTIDQIFDSLREDIDHIVRTPLFSSNLGYPQRYTTSNPIEDCPSWETDHQLDYCGIDSLDCGSMQRPLLTTEQCAAMGGVYRGDPGDGSVHQADFRCESGLPPRGTISEPSIEGAVCC